MRDDATDEYCVILCATQDCPLDLCKCADTPTMEEVKEAARREAAEAEKRGTESIVPTLPQAETEVPGRDAHPIPNPRPSPIPGRAGRPSAWLR